MNIENPKPASIIMNLLNKLFCLIFLVTGALNIWLVHPVPGLFYIILFLVYLPTTNNLLKAMFGFEIPPIIKVIVGFIVLWGTLAVGDLAEILGL